MLRRNLDRARPVDSRSTSPRRWSSFATPETTGGRRRSTPARTSTSRPPTWPVRCASTIQTLEAMGIPVEYSFHEDSPSQHEIDLRHTDALSMADSVMTFRLVVREAATGEGLYATFMPKPLEGVQGSGMHTPQPVRGDENAFHEPGSRTSSPRSPRGSSPDCFATPTRSPPSPTRR